MEASSMADFATLVVFMFAGLAAILLLFFFLHFFTFFRRLLASRMYMNDPHAPIKPMARPFDWVVPVLKASEADIIECAGLDAAVYLRMFQFSIQLFAILTVLCLPVLLPLNAVSSHQLFTDGAYVSNSSTTTISTVTTMSIGNTTTTTTTKTVSSTTYNNTKVVSSKNSSLDNSSTSSNGSSGNSSQPPARFNRIFLERHTGSAGIQSSRAGGLNDLGTGSFGATTVRVTTSTSSSSNSSGSGNGNSTIYNTGRGYYWNSTEGCWNVTDTCGNTTLKQHCMGLVGFPSGASVNYSSTGFTYLTGANYTELFDNYTTDGLPFPEGPWTCIPTGNFTTPNSTTVTTTTTSVTTSTPYNSSTLNFLSISNVPPGSPVFYAHLVMLYVVSLATFMVTWWTYRHVWGLRHDYLASRAKVLHPEEYVVLVTDVPQPPKLRQESSVGLFAPKEGVVPTVKLSKPVVRRLFTLLRICTMGMVQPPQRVDCTAASAVADSQFVDRYFSRLYPEAYVNNQGVASYGKVMRAYRRWRHAVQMLDRTRFRFQESVERNRGRKKPRLEEELVPMRRNGLLRQVFMIGPREESIPYWIRRVEEASTHLKEAQRLAATRRRTGAAFVAFSKRRSSAVAVQTSHALQGSAWLVHSAPEPRDVVWQNLEPRFWERRIRTQVANGIFVCSVVFFYLPVTAASFLISFETLATIFPPLQSIDQNGVLYKALTLILPAVGLRVCYWIAPPLMLLLSHMQGCTSTSEAERLAAERFYYILLCNVFFGFFFTTSVLQQIKLLLEQPSYALEILGQSVPSTSGFYLSYVMTSTIIFGVELLRLPIALFVYLFRVLFTGVHIADREKLWNQGGINYHIFFPYQNLVITIGLVYAVIAPIILPFVAFYSCIGYLVWKHQIMYVYSYPYQTGGLLWIKFVGHVNAALIIAQVTVIGIFVIKQAYLQAALAAPLPFLTFYFMALVHAKFTNTFQFLPLELAVDVDEYNQSHHMVQAMDALAPEYSPFCMRPLLNPDLSPNAPPSDNIHQLINPDFYVSPLEATMEEARKASVIAHSRGLRQHGKGSGSFSGTYESTVGLFGELEEGGSSSDDGDGGGGSAVVVASAAGAAVAAGAAAAAALSGGHVGGAGEAAAAGGGVGGGGGGGWSWGAMLARLGLPVWLRRGQSSTLQADEVGLNRGDSGASTGGPAAAAAAAAAGNGRCSNGATNGGKDGMGGIQGPELESTVGATGNDVARDGIEDSTDGERAAEESVKEGRGAEGEEEGEEEEECEKGPLLRLSQGHDVPGSEEGEGLGHSHAHGHGLLLGACLHPAGGKPVGRVGAHGIAPGSSAGEQRLGRDAESDPMVAASAEDASNGGDETAGGRSGEGVRREGDGVGMEDEKDGERVLVGEGSGIRGSWEDVREGMARPAAAAANDAAAATDPPPAAAAAAAAAAAVSGSTRGELGEGRMESIDEGREGREGANERGVREDERIAAACVSARSVWASGEGSASASVGYCPSWSSTGMSGDIIQYATAATTEPIHAAADTAASATTATAALAAPAATSLSCSFAGTPGGAAAGTGGCD